MPNVFARELRRNSTEAERRLWSRLRKRQLDGVRFRRQVPIGPYVVDFACLAERLVVEIDGGQHALDADRDAARTAWLETRGYRILRFWNNEMLENLEGVCGRVLQSLREQMVARTDRRPPA